jgi:serine/threonine protein kinase
MHMAFKTIRTGGSEAAQNQVKAALKEAYALKEAQHENLIRLEGICIDDPQRLGVLMEYAEQGTLRHVLEANPEMGDKERRLLIRGILRGLAKLHSHTPTPILHGDLKGTNVLVMTDGTPKLADFGQASGASSGISMSMSVSKAHRGGGTPIYSAPELFADIFADSSDSEDDDCVTVYTMACDVYSGGGLDVRSIVRAAAVAEGN